MWAVGCAGGASGLSADARSRREEINPMGNPFVHCELMTTDVGKAKTDRKSVV